MQARTVWGGGTLLSHRIGDAATLATFAAGQTPNIPPSRAFATMALGRYPAYLP